MSKKNIAAALGSLSLIITLFTPSAASATDCTGFNSGDGTEATPYLITTVTEFENLENCKLDKFFKIGNDIDFGGTEPGTGISSFVGKLDGNGKTLSNLKINAGVDTGSDESYIAVFQSITGDASITKLRVDGLELVELASTSISGFIGKATANFTLSDLRLSNVEHTVELPKNNNSDGVGGLIGQAFLSSTSTIEKIDLEVSLECHYFMDCGGLIGESVIESAGALIETVYVQTNFARLDTAFRSYSGGLIGDVVGGDGMTADLTVTDSLVSLTNQTPQDGYRVGGVVGKVGSNAANTTVELILDRISIGGVIPDGDNSRAALVAFLKADGNDTIFTPKEIVIAASFASPENGTKLVYGVRNFDAVPDTSLMKLYHDTESTNNTAPITKIATADKSDPDTFKRVDYELTITDNLQPLFDWYVQEPDTQGSADGLDPNGYAGSVFNGYPVPANLAKTGFLGNRFQFKQNGVDEDPDPKTITRIGYANDGSGIDTIANPFARNQSEDGYGFEFSGWSKSQDGSEGILEVGEAIIGSDETNVYAQWQEIFTVTFRVVGEDSGSAPDSIDAKPTFLVPGAGTLVRSGFEFGGWGIVRTDTVYEPGQTVTATGNLTLESLWNPAFDVTFNNGGADSGSVTDITDKTSITAPNKGDLVRNGFTLAGWQDQDGNNYAVGDTINLSKDLTLTAQWAELFDVSFNTGGADSGSVAAQTDKLSFTVPAQGDLVRNGFTFSGWQDQDGTSYTVGQRVNLAKDLALTAQWTASAPPPAPAPVFRPYTGPEPFFNGIEMLGCAITELSLTGTNLYNLDQVTVGGIEVDFEIISDRAINLNIGCLTPGSHDLTFHSSWGNNTAKGKVVVIEEPVAITPAVNQKVNAGSFKGYVAVYALGHEGKRLSAKIGKDWVVIPEIPARDNNLYRVTDFTGAGVDIQVRIYIDRELLETIPLTTK